MAMTTCLTLMTKKPGDVTELTTGHNYVVTL